MSYLDHLGWNNWLTHEAEAEEAEAEEDVLDSEEDLSEEYLEEEEEEEEVNSVDAETLRLGQSPKQKKLKNSEPKKREPKKREPKKGKESQKKDDDDEVARASQRDGDEMGGVAGAQSMRALYWEVVHEAQKRIKRENPDMPAKEVLKLARAEWLASISKNTLQLKKLPLGTII